VLLLLENGFQIPTDKPKLAYLIEKDMPPQELLAVFDKAKESREVGHQVSVVIMKKNKKFQKEQLVLQGYEQIVEVYRAMESTN